MSARSIRLLKAKAENRMIEMFPDIPKTTITSYLHHNPTLSYVDYVVHFLGIHEPTTKKLDLETEMLIAQARTIIKEQNRPKPPPAAKPEETNRENEAKIQEMVVSFEVSEPNQAFSARVSESIAHLRMEKKRPRFVGDEFLAKMAFAYAEELMNGYISIDSDDWRDWLRAHPENVSDSQAIINFFPRVAEPVASIADFLSRDPEARKIVLSTVRYLGIGVSISKGSSVFLVMFAANVT